MNNKFYDLLRADWILTRELSVASLLYGARGTLTIPNSNDIFELTADFIAVKIFTLSFSRIYVNFSRMFTLSYLSPQSCKNKVVK